MSQTLSIPTLRRRDPAVLVTGALVVAIIVVAGFAWAKWLPYAAKIDLLDSTGVWEGTSMLATAGDTPSLSGGWEFLVAYTSAVWKALVVALLLAAALDALVSKQWLARLLSRGGDLRQAGTGALLSLPSMMCTCCTAPVTVTLRRAGAGIAAVVGHWLGNPLLNPAVLVFLFLVAPWQWGVTRGVVGLAVVIAASLIAARLADETAAPTPVPEDEPGPRLAELPGRFLGSLWRLGRVLVPEYAVVVLLVGAFSGWLSRFTELTGSGGIVALLVALAVGLLLVVPTGGEIPVMIGLAALGAGTGVLGVLLITLPALSLPSMVMVARALSVRITLATAGVVAAGGLLGAGLLTALG
jgi:hypothetical protein